MPSKKKERSCPFSTSISRRKKPKKSFSKDRAEIFAESDKGSYYNQEGWLNERSDLQSTLVTREQYLEHVIEVFQSMRYFH